MFIAERPENEEIQIKTCKKKKNLVVTQYAYLSFNFRSQSVVYWPLTEPSMKDFWGRMIQLCKQAMRSCKKRTWIGIWKRVKWVDKRNFIVG